MFCNNVEVTDILIPNFHFHAAPYCVWIIDSSSINRGRIQHVSAGRDPFHLELSGLSINKIAVGRSKWIKRQDGQHRCRTSRELSCDTVSNNAAYFEGGCRTNRYVDTLYVGSRRNIYELGPPHISRVCEIDRRMGFALTRVGRAQYLSGEGADQWRGPSVSRPSGSLSKALWAGSHPLR